MNVIPHVRQHNTARGLWHNLLWLYSEEAGIDTQGGPPVPGNDGNMQGAGGGGGGGRAKLLAAMARKGASIDLDLSRDIGRDKVVPPLFQSPPLMPVIKASSGSASSSQLYGPFLEVPTFDGPDDEEDEEEEQYEFEDVSPELEFQPQYQFQFSPSYYPPPPPAPRQITDDAGRTKGSNAIPNRFYDNHNNTISPIPSPSANPNANLSLRTIDEGEEDSATVAAAAAAQQQQQDGPHPGRRVDLSDSSVFIRGRRSFFSSSHPGGAGGGGGGGKGGGLLHTTHTIVSAPVSGERVGKSKVSCQVLKFQAFLRGVEKSLN